MKEFQTNSEKQDLSLDERIQRDLLLIDEAKKSGLHLLLTQTQRHLVLTLESKFLRDDPSMTHFVLKQRLAGEIAKLSETHDLSTVLPW